MDKVQLSIRAKNIERFKKNISEVLSKIPDEVINKKDAYQTLKWLVYRMSYKIKGFSGRDICPRCGQARIGPPRNWMAFFQVITDLEQLRDLDKWIRKLIYDYIYQIYNVRIGRKELRRSGFNSLVNEKFNIPNTRLIPCLCDIEQNGLWNYAEDLFLHKKFKTLAHKIPFKVELVNNQGIVTAINAKRYLIPKKAFLDSWEELKKKGSLTRVELEHQGIKNTSHLVSLLSEISGVKTEVWPIKLYQEGAHPASFLVRNKGSV